MALPFRTTTGVTGTPFQQTSSGAPTTGNLLENFPWIAGTNTISPVPIFGGKARCIATSTDNPRIWKSPDILIPGQQYSLSYLINTGDSLGGLVARIDTEFNIPTGNKYGKYWPYPSNDVGETVDLDAFRNWYNIGIASIPTSADQYAEIFDNMSLTRKTDIAYDVPWQAGTNTAPLSTMDAGEQGTMLVVTATDAVENPRVSKSLVNLSPGTVYRVAFIAKKDSVGGSMFARVSNDANLMQGTLANWEFNNTNLDGVLMFTATKTEHYFGFVADTTAVGQSFRVSYRSSVTVAS